MNRDAGFDEDPAGSSTFDRLEVIGTADFRNLTEVCDDGSTVTSRVRITGGHEEEAEDGVTTLDRDYLRVQIQSGCTGIIQVTTNDADRPYGLGSHRLGGHRPA